MNKRDRANEFLQYWRDIAEQNPNLQFGTSIGTDYIYKSLIRLGVKEEEKTTDVSLEPSKSNPNYILNMDAASPYAEPNSTFNNWIKYYANSDKTNVFISKKQKEFCQFISNDEKAKKAKEFVKIYLPQDADHLEESAKLIFNFLEDNNIPHKSIIGRKITSNNIIIRLINPDDANRLLGFIENNKYLQEGLIPANPFAFEHNGVAMTVDGLQSYGHTVASLIDMYIANRKENKKLNNVCTEDFYNYVYQLYDGFYKQPDPNTPEYKEFDSLIDRLIETKGHKISEEEQQRIIENQEQIVSLILKTIDPKFDLNEYYMHYAKCAHTTYVGARLQLATNRMLVEALEALTLRFGHPTGYDNVRLFYFGGEEMLITRNNDLRRRIVDTGFRRNLANILNHLQVDYDTYVKNVLNQYHIDLNELGRMKSK